MEPFESTQELENIYDYRHKQVLQSQRKTNLRQRKINKLGIGQANEPCFKIPFVNSLNKMQNAITYSFCQLNENNTKNTLFRTLQQAIVCVQNRLPLNRRPHN